MLSAGMLSTSDECRQEGHWKVYASCAHPAGRHPGVTQGVTRRRHPGLWGSPICQHPMIDQFPLITMASRQARYTGQKHEYKH
jgi:hypothetical protein